MAQTSRVVGRIGAHRYTFTLPDELSFVFHGPLSEDDAHAIVALLHEIGDRHGPFYSLLDVSRFQSSDARVRRILIEAGGKPYPLRASAIWGASFTMRVAMTMVITACTHLSPGRFPLPVEFVANEDKARAWIAAQREAQRRVHVGNAPAALVRLRA